MAARTDWVDRGPSDPETAFNTVYAADFNALGTEVNGKAAAASVSGKVDGNSAITAATKTKITYDAKGLVTAGADATQDDIGDGATYRQYSATEKAKLAAITGTNTGDQTSVTGNAGTATKLATARTINGVSFDGSANITVEDSTKEATTNKGAANGYAPLDASALVPAVNLPSYVDDVLEYATLAAMAGNGVTGKIFVALDSNKTYRWSGSAFVEISPSPGSTDSVTEGSSNLYYTQARADARVAAGNSATTTKLATARAINGVNFDGTAAIVIKPRVGTTASSATPTIDMALYEQYNITALAAAITSWTISNPADGLKLIIRIKDNGTARALAFSSVFRAIGVTLPTTTVVSKTMYLGCIYCGADSKLDVVAVGTEA